MKKTKAREGGGGKNSTHYILCKKKSGVWLWLQSLLRKEAHIRKRESERESEREREREGKGAKWRRKEGKEVFFDRRRNRFGKEDKSEIKKKK